MPRPMAICIEDLEAPTPAARYLRCVALAGAEPGLRLCTDGGVRWISGEGQTAFELWVSLDQRLMLLRPEGAPPVRVSRAGRTLDAPLGQPVVLLGDDRVDAAGRSLRIHVHGETTSVHAPAFLELEAEPRAGALGKLARSAAAALALGAMVGAGGCDKVEVRNQPPKKDGHVQLDQGPDRSRDIEVRDFPPTVDARLPDATPDAGPPADGSTDRADAGKMPRAPGV